MDEVEGNASGKYFMGLALAIISTLFIGSSFIIKKIGLKRLGYRGLLRAGSGGYGYLKDWIWWFGLATMAIGELANFIAYTFAPASLITPLGALSVLVSAILAAKFLGEELNLLGKIGCVLCLIGSTIIVIHSPKEESVSTLAALVERLHSYPFMVYVITVITMSITISLCLGPRYGEQNVLVYITLCSAVGSLTVVSCKGLGLAIKEVYYDQNEDANTWILYGFLGNVVFCILIQMNYLNKALDLFNTSLVTPVYYVFFTTLVVTASSIVFNEWNGLTSEDVFGSFCGFLVVIIAIILLNGFKDVDVSLSSLMRTSKSEHDKYHGYQTLMTRTV